MNKEMALEVLSLDLFFSMSLQITLPDRSFSGNATVTSRPRFL